MSSDSSLALDSEEEIQITGSAGSQAGVFSEELLETLECPVCFKYMRSPIHNCVAGHSICSNCKQKGVTTCPVCRSGFSSSRNYVAEEMAKRILFPCENKDRGCTMRALGSEVDQHQVNCSHRIYKCPMDCKWIGGRDELSKHYSDEHPKCIFESDTYPVEWSWNGSFEDVKYYYLMPAYEKLFLWFGHINANKRYITSCVHYIGDAEEAEMFTYTITLKSEDGRRSLCYTDVTKNDSTDLDTITQSTKLFFAHEDTYENFADKDGEVLLKIEVAKV